MGLDVAVALMHDEKEHHHPKEYIKVQKDAGV
jgi:hypothetical protein